MLVLSREIGQSIVIEDVRITVIGMWGHIAEVALQKIKGGKATVVTLQRGEHIDACYDAQLVFIESSGRKLRIGIEAPRGTYICREEVHDQVQKELGE